MQFLKHALTAIGGFALLLLIGLAPVLAFAQGSLPANIADPYNAQCQPFIPQCPCGQVPGPTGGCVTGQNMNKCPCGGPVQGGTVTGICAQQLKCEAVSFDGGDEGGGAVDKGLQALQQLLGQILGKLGQGGGGGGQQQGGQQPQQPTEEPSSVQDIIDGLGGTSSGGNSIIDDLFNDIFGGGDSSQGTGTSTAGGSQATTTNVQGALQDAVSGTAGGSQSGSQTQATSSTGIFGSGTGVPGSEFTSLGGRSEIQTRDGSATFVAGVRDESQNTEVSGFIGSSQSGTQSTGIIGRLCTSRPWDNRFVSFFIAPSFFDGLCTRGGYQVGETTTTTASNTETRGTFGGQATETTRATRGITCTPSAVRSGGSAALAFSCGSARLTDTVGFSVVDSSVKTATVAPRERTQYGIICSDGFESACTVDIIEPQVSIWADPQSVRLGTRTVIYWNTQDVESCRVTGPNFSETGVRGGASTAAINGDSTFSIACVSADGATTTANVLVELAL